MCVGRGGDIPTPQGQSPAHRALWTASSGGSPLTLSTYQGFQELCELLEQMSRPRGAEGSWEPESQLVGQKHGDHREPGTDV